MADPRLYQIGTLASLLVYGMGWLDFDITASRVVLLLTTGLADVFATLTNKKFVLFEILADDAFTNGGHREIGLMDLWSDGVVE